MQPISRTILALTVAHILSFGMTLPSHASSIITAVEAGGDVVFTTAAGASFDLTGLTLDSTANRGVIIIPEAGTVITGANSLVDLYTGAIIGPAQYGTGVFEQATATSGPYIGIGSGANLLVPAGYQSGNNLLESTAVYAGQTFATLGIIPGTHVWTLPSADTVTLNIVSAVPIPAAVWLFGSALGILGWMRRKAA